MMQEDKTDQIQISNQAYFHDLQSADLEIIFQSSLGQFKDIRLLLQWSAKQTNKPLLMELVFGY